MKDYLIEKEEEGLKRGFVLDYTINGDTLTVYYADGSIIKKNIKDNEEEITTALNTIMKAQIQTLDMDNKEFKLKENLLDCIKNCMAVIVSTPIMICAVNILVGLSATTFAACLGLGACALVKKTKELINSKKLLDDFEKNAKFVRKENYINKELASQNIDDLNLNVSKKTQKFISENDNKIDIYNLNDIKLKELNELLDYFQRSKELEESLNKPKVLRK